ncbi:MAG: hypothetical protein QNI86_06075 [Halieaceae bacterium]|nr:hypothetical protein [Halieaceae bacterium]
MTPKNDSGRLDSWKAIANYLNRSVRTVRRWEGSEGLPVHRHMHQSQGSVYAFREELDAWREQRSQAESPPPAPTRKPPMQPDQDSLAVLPFTFVGANPSEAYVADGFSDEIIADLSRLRSLRVISRTSSMSLKGSSDDAVTLGKSLGVGYLLEGTVRSSGSKLRVSVSLIDAVGDQRIWGDKFDGSLEDAFEIQERIARQVVDALEITLSPREERQLSNREFDNVEAWQCVLQARQSSLRWRRDAIDHAIELLRQGLAIAGDSVELHATLGRTWLQYREAGLDTSDTPLKEAEQCAARVQALDPEAAAGFALNGWLAYARGDMEDAVAELRAGLQRDWNNIDTISLLCNCYLISGRVALARPLIEQSLSLDPLTPLTRCMPGWAAVLEGDAAGAVESYRDMFEMDPGNPIGRLFYIWILALNGEAERVAELAAGFSEATRATLPGQIAGLLATALASPEEFASLPQPAPEVLPPTDMFPRLLAQANALADQAEPAVRWLEQAVSLGFINYPYLSKHDPILNRLLGYAPYDALLETVRQRWESFDA